MRAAPLLLLLSPALFAQPSGTPATVYVIAPKTSFFWGETLKVRPVVWDAQGNQLGNVPITWSVQPSSAATVASDGTVTPLQLATFRVSATAGSVSGQVYLQVLPKVLTVFPDLPSMLVGARQHVRAIALDTNGNTIPDVRVQWQLSNLLGAWDPRTPLASISSDGTLKALVAGRVRIVASIPYTGPAGFLPYASGENTVLITPPETYQFDRLYVAEPFTSATLFGLGSQLFVAEDGSISFVASLDGTGSALVAWNHGQTKTLLAEGRPDAVSGQPLLQISAIARDGAGNWLVQEGNFAVRSQVSWGPPDALNPILAPGTLFTDTENSQNFTISRNSLNNAGAAVVIADYTQAGTHKATTGLFSGTGSPVRSLVANTTDGIPGFANAAVSFTPAFGITDDGSIWFVATIGGTAMLLRSDPLGNIQKILGVGDSFPLGAGTVSSVQSNGDATNQNFFVSPNGDVIVALSSGNTAAWLRWPRGDPSAPPQVLPTVTNGIYWHDPSVGTLLDTNYQGQGRGLYLWNDQMTPLLLRGDTSLDGSPVAAILSASSNSAGQIVAMVQTANSPMLIVRIAPDQQVLLRAGDTLTVSAPPVLTAFIPGIRSGPPLLIAGGKAGSIVTIDEQGQVAPLVPIGASLPGGHAFAGSNLSNSGFGQVRGVSGGQVFFSDPSGSYVWSAGSIAAVLPAPTSSPSGGNLGAPFGFDANSSGQLAGLFSDSGWSVYLAQNGQVQPIVTPGGPSGMASSSGSCPAIDASGEVAFLAPGAYGDVVLWDGQALRRILTVGDSMPDGRTVIRTGWQLKSHDGGFVIWAAMSDRQYVYLKYRNGAWDYLIHSGDVLPTGRSVGYVDWQFAVNGLGDLVFLSGGGGGVADIAVLRSGKYYEAHSMGDLTGEAELLVAVSSWHINDDGTVYILGVNDSGRQVIYRGTPLAN